ncbi:unnamed protein product [Polarella glacialis]|uniref:Nucleotide-diphospho-sugar transferase domain-containing protein n=1 Tax=Polarella glacialis TaxID=89957 RepID=A0A813HAH3_POLGL|nr:unnamed protein product [Polarella glacialis]CAE8649383.1 unnamed protein product [Polarella glacialis]
MFVTLALTKHFLPPGMIRRPLCHVVPQGLESASSVVSARIHAGRCGFLGIKAPRNTLRSSPSGTATIAALAGAGALLKQYRRVFGLAAVHRAIGWRRPAARAATTTTTVEARTAETSQPFVRLCFAADENFRPLRDQFVSSIVDSNVELDLCESYVQDMGANPDRAAGGKAVYLFKIQHMLDMLETIDPGDFLIYSDVDVQFFGEILPCVREGIAGRDACFQCEFVDTGVNIGFMAVRRTEASFTFWKEVHHIVSRDGGLDQRVVNNLLHTEFADNLGMRWGRFPTSVWASSQALTGPPPEGVIVHHANWVYRDKPTYSSEVSGANGACNPSAKRAQLQELRRLVLAGDIDGQKTLASGLAADGFLSKYQSRYFGAERSGPAWTVLPEGHVGRPGSPRSRWKQPKPT